MSFVSVRTRANFSPARNVFSTTAPLASGAVVEKTFRAGEKFPRVRTETKDMQYLYDAGDEVVFMDQDTYEQTSLPRGTVEDALEYLLPSSTVQMMLVNGKPSGVQLPASVELAVSETEPGVRATPSPT